AESVLRSAGGTPFAGDFVVATQSDPGRLDLAVVDVSGKGEAAGTRALMLSGALGGLLGALPSARFLPAANEYLLRQRWQEGFATAVHLTIDLRTGDFEIRTAGHPPALHLQSGSGRWQAVVSEGPVLGLVEDAAFTVARGRVHHGDALMLYTDGLVETPQRDLTMGIDRLRGRAERLLPQGLTGGAEQLVEQLGSANDDCALLMLHRG
ncbi:PP2C family protein-serine/threonine phosphatase, partial [Nocardioides sp.]|uniref:PP2C family protein-serine/threonine phosphatase n=1 Tax=Nocardioides sp. TaxID=35761 RepID=UPI0027323611